MANNLPPNVIVMSEHPLWKVRKTTTDRIERLRQILRELREGAKDDRDDSREST